MQIRKMRDGEEEIKLSERLKSHSVIETAVECGITRDSIYKAIENNRDVRLYVKGGYITYAYEIKPTFKFST